MNKTLLPPHSSSQLEKKLSFTFADINDLAIPINPIWNIEKCPTDLLPYLAWSLSVDEWDSNWSDEQQRSAIKNSVYVHQHKGTIASIRRVLKSAGYGDIEILEGIIIPRYNGSISYDHQELYGAKNSHWAEYRVILKKPITIEQAEQVKQLLHNTAPARCRLTGLDYEQASHLYNNKIIFNGQYSYGVA